MSNQRFGLGPWQRTGVGLVAILTCHWLAVPAAAADRTVPLLDDTRFERGFAVLSASMRPQKEIGVIRPSEATQGTPAWRLAQWYSRFNLGDAKPESADGPAERFFDGAKAVTFFRPGAEADVRFSVNAVAEYDGKAPPPGNPWPHLLAERELLESPRLGELRRLDFAVAYRLVRCEMQKCDGFELAKHTAQFQIYFTVRNVRGAKGRGDFLWFGLPLYDARYRMPAAYVAPDIQTERILGTDKLIYLVSAETFTSQSTHDGQWIAIEQDLLPLIYQGLQTAWDRGYLQGSKDPADYAVNYVNIGWEVTGPLNVEFDLRGLKLDAVYGE